MTEEPMTLPDSGAWRTWLDANEDVSDGVWMVLAKAGTTSPTSLSYAQALDEALCSGWIDGQRKRRDDSTFLQRFTPRRRQSLWSKRNVGLAESLVEQGRMRPRGHAEIERARLDGRWERAYPGAATLEVPDDVLRALEASPEGASRFGALTTSERHALLLQVITAAPALREKRIVTMVRRLEGPRQSTTEAGGSTPSSRS